MVLDHVGLDQDFLVQDLKALEAGEPVGFLGDLLEGDLGRHARYRGQ
jgi:hypothetical protein